MPVFEQAEDIEKKRKKPGTARVVLVQCVCCAVLILFFWLFEVLGGNAYMQLKTAFMNALQNNALLATVAQLFENTVPDESYELTDGTTVSGTTTAGTTVTTVTTLTTAAVTATTDGAG